MMRLLGSGALAILALMGLAGSMRPTADAPLRRPAADAHLTRSVAPQCHGDECNGKFPSANGCVSDQHPPDDDMVYVVALFQANDPGFTLTGALYYSRYCNAVFGEYTTNDPQDQRFLGIYRMSNYGGVEQGYDKIQITGEGTYRTQMVGYDNNQAKICVNFNDSDPDLSQHDTFTPYPCTGWR
jgi:hypothetical protein